MNSAADIAKSYIRRGWNPVPVPFKSKAPIGVGWQLRVISEKDIDRHFNGAPQNIGVLLGPTSSGLTDIDLDCPEAIDLAPVALLPTKAIFGRASARASHWLYTSTLADTLAGATLQFNDPTPLRENRLLLELRVGGNTGAQTVFPGSTHESGEAIQWEETGDPAKVENEDTLRRAKTLASLCLFARYWPAEGGRHKAALALGGFMSRAGFRPELIKYFAERIAQVAGDTEHRDRKQAAEDAARAHLSGKKSCGFRSIKELFGQHVAERIAEWLDYQAETTEQEQQPEEDAQASIVATLYNWKDPATIARRQWLYGYLLVRKFVTGTVSPGGVGKSSLIAAETMAMVSGKDLLGTLPKDKLRVWLWNLEDPQEETDRKIQAAALHYGLSSDDIGDRLFVDSGRDQPLVIATATRTGGATIARPVSEALVAQIIARKIDVLTIDPFVSCHDVPENLNQVMDLIVKEWGKIADRGNCAVHLVHHTPKMAGAEVTAEAARGGKAFTDACRVVRAINRMSKEEGEKTGVENHRLYFRTLNDKANLQPPADSSDWFKLRSVDLGNGHLSGPGDSVGVVTTWEWPDPLAGMTGADFDKAAQVIRGGKWRENAQAKDWVGRAVAEALNFNIESKSERAKINGMVKAWLAAGSLIVVQGEDEKRMPRKFVEVREEA